MGEAAPLPVASRGDSAPQQSQGNPVRGYIDGCFDIMHSGHFNAIRQAKCLCDVLVVGVHSDPEIEENKALPVMRQNERYALLEHVKWIDEIVHDVPYSPQLATLQRANADFCVHGDDMPVNSQGVCAYDEMRLAGRLRIVKRTEGVSTTDLIGRLLTLARSQHTSEHTWKDLLPANSDVLRVTPDDAIEHCLQAGAADPRHGLPRQGGQDETSAGLPEVPKLAAFKAALEAVDGLAASYGVSEADALTLKGKISACAGAELEPALLDNISRTPSSSPGGGGSTRTSAPVQLLASTRRITEFATARRPAENDKVVYVCGSFDMFHVGHAQFLKEARALGTFLLVGIHDDLTVSRAKGTNYPVMNTNERVLNVCACKWVDEVIIGAPTEVTEDLIKTWDIHVVARGTGHLRSGGQGYGDEERYTVPEKLGVCTKVPSKWPDLCHETVVQRIISSRELYLKRNNDRALREDIYYKSKDVTNSPLEA